MRGPLVDSGPRFVHGSSHAHARASAGTPPGHSPARKHATVHRGDRARRAPSFVCACSPKEAAKPDSAKVAQTGAPAATTGGSYDPATHTATVKATEFAFAAPDTIQAGWTTFHLMNDGTTFHHLAIVRIDSGKTMADVGAAMKSKGPPPKWIVEVGGPNAADPKAQTNGTCEHAAGPLRPALLRRHAGPQVPHIAKGMVRPLTVVASTFASTEPTADPR